MRSASGASEKEVLPNGFEKLRSWEGMESVGGTGEDMLECAGVVVRVGWMSSRAEFYFEVQRINTSTTRR